MRQIDEELKGEFCYLYLQEESKNLPEIKDPAKFFQCILYTLLYEPGPSFKVKFETILSWFILHEEDIGIITIDKFNFNNFVLFSFIQKIIYCIKNKEVFTKEELNKFITRLDKEECGLYITCFQRIYDYFIIIVLE